MKTKSWGKGDKSPFGSLRAKPLFIILSLLFAIILTACGNSNPSLSITGDSSVAVGYTKQLAAVAKYKDGTKQDVTDSSAWSSSDTTIATVNTKGIVTGVAAGTASIKVTANGVSTTTTLTVVAIKTGVFLDSAVAGIYFECGSQSGYTGSDGSFTYEDGNTVTFKVGDIVIGIGKGKAVITPVDLVSGAKDQTDATVTNITRFLMTIDDDQDPTNGIQITTAIHTAAKGKSVTFTVSSAAFTTNTTSLITTLTTTSTAGVTTLLDASTAQKHLQDTLTLSSIIVTPASPSIANRTTQQFTATGISSDGTTQDITNVVTWSSSKTSVAAINSGGLALAVTAGTTTITASLVTASSTSISGTASLTVTGAALSSIAVTPTNTIIPYGAKKQFIATGTFSDGTTQDLTSLVTWSSSNTTIASISNSGGSVGLAAGAAAGNTSVTAAAPTSLGSISGTTNITVTGAILKSILITPVNPSIAYLTTKQFTAAGTFSDNSTLDLTTSVTWSSSSKGIATISNASGSNGLAGGISAGTTTITAAFGSVTATTTLTVNNVTLSSIAITPANPTIANGTTKQFTATGIFSDNSTQDLTTSVTWSSSSTGYATINTSGLATAVGGGSTTITAALGGINGIKGTTALTVTTITLTSITVTPANPSITNVATKQFTATGTYSDNSTQILTTSVTWSSSDTTKATISNASGSIGLATGVAAGSSTITGTLGSISGTTALTVTSNAAVPSIAGGWSHTLALKSDGTVWAWGLNQYDQLGDGTTADRLTPVQSNITRIMAISGGAFFSTALKSDGTVWTWGGDGNMIFYSTSVQSSSITGVSAISAGNVHIIALKPDGTVWAWGRNQYGALGNGTTNSSTTPVQVSITGLSAISAGCEDTIALKPDGTVWAWGRNQYGELGDGTTQDRYTPVQISGLTGVTAVSAGFYYHTIILKSDGTVWAWGGNWYGQLGNSTNIGTYNPNPTPVQVSGLTGITAIAGGANYSIALKSDGTVWAWGGNRYGQLGNSTNIGTDNPNPTPTQVSGLTGVTAIAAGGNQTIALKSDGTVWAWGINDHGELGIGTSDTNAHPTPVQVLGTGGVGYLNLK